MYMNQKNLQYKQILKFFLDTLPSEIQGEVRQAFCFAEDAHLGQKRKSGEPYIIHPLQVGIDLWDFYHNKSLLIGGFLHDTVEDSPSVNIEAVYEMFGSEVGFIVDALNKRSNTFYEYPEKIFKHRLDRLIWAGEHDFKVYLVKLADRKHNISTLDALNRRKQVNISFETQAIYEPLKDITKFLVISDIEEAKKHTDQFFVKHKITTYIEKKNFLIESSFQNTSSELFGLILKDVQSVVWSLDDYDTFVKFTENFDFQENVKLIRMIAKKDSFFVSFQFTKSFQFTDIQLQPTTFTL